MAKSREKKVIHSGITDSEMENAFLEYAKADAMLQKVQAKIEIEMVAIREKFASKITDLTAIKERNFDILQTFALENQGELFCKKKSMETVHGTMGFRTGTPKLKTLKGFTWGAVLNLLKEFLPNYVRISEEPAKDKLLADRDCEEVNKLFQKVGITVVQDESFYVEPKKEVE
jgi:phage host-nuclease inhibitor protein Gam